MISIMPTRYILSVCITLFIAATTLSACGQKNKHSDDTFQTTSGKKVKFTPIKHASIRITFNGKEIEVDPVSGLMPQTDYSKMPKADIILVTHEHQDHLDTTAIKALEKPSTVIVTNANCAKIIGKGKVMRNGDHLRLSSDIEVEAVPAYNTSASHAKFHPKGRDNGFILTLDGLRIYISGDTEDIPEMKDFKNIDIAFLSTNQPFTMTPEQTVRAAKIINPKVLFPYHFSDTNVRLVADMLKDAVIDVRIRNYQ